MNHSPSCSSSSTSKKEEKLEMKPNSRLSLSQYLHCQFETLVNPKEEAEKKVEFLENFNSFLVGAPPQKHVNVIRNVDVDSKVANPERSPHLESFDEDLHSPLTADAYLTLHPPEKDTSPTSSLKTVQRHTKSGIQLPVLNWNGHFRKGYSLLMWVRLHPPDENIDKGIQKKQRLSQILYKFANSSSPLAYGIQATLQTASQSPSSSTSHSIKAMLKIETLPSHESTINSSSTSHHHNHAHSPSLILPLTLPVSKWTLIGVQHSFPYLKRPHINVCINGVEVGKGEVSYPTLGGELGENMSENYILCNFNQRLDVASMGLYKEAVPTFLQGIITEHGISSIEGVVPIVPPVVQCRDAVVMGSSDGGGIHSGKVIANGSGTGRGIGIPLSIGVLLSSDGSGTGELMLQKLLSKMVMGWNARDAFLVGEERVVIKVKGGCSVGSMTDVPKIGIVQPSPPLSAASGGRSNSGITVFGSGKRGKSNINDGFSSLVEGELLITAKSVGNATLHHVTHAFIQRERDFFRRNKQLSQQMQQDVSLDMLPSYQIPTSTEETTPIPSFLSTYSSINPHSFIFLAFHLALPPPGYAYSLQMEYYRNSFSYLYDLVVYKNGILAARLIDLLSATLNLGGQMREEILQCGCLHTLTILLRRVLLRAGRLGMFSDYSTGSENTVKNAKIRTLTRDRLWQFYSSKETSEDDILDMTSHSNSAPKYIPFPIVQASCSLLQACCGPVLVENKGKRPPMGLHIRRISDVALTAIFGFALDFDLWGGDLQASSHILREVVDRYCVEDFDAVGQVTGVGHSIKHEKGYGWLLRGQVTVQYLLDVIRLRFGSKCCSGSNKSDGRSVVSNIPARSTLSENDKCQVEATVSLAHSLSRILYTMLKYSLSTSKSISRSEHDITAAVAALSDCPLGSVGAHVILTAMRDILVYCEVVSGNCVLKDVKSVNDSGPSSRFTSVLSRLQSITASNATSASSTTRREETNKDDRNKKLKQIKSEMVARLGRNLLMSQFHDVVAPMLLSRTVFDGRRVMNKNSIDQVENRKSQVECVSYTEEDDDGELAVEWCHHWRISLVLFTWLTSVAGPEGEISAKSTGSLLFHSGKAGSLYGCLLGRNECAENDFFSTLILPPNPTPSSAVTPGSTFASSNDRVARYMNDLSHRLRVVMHLLGGLVASLVSKSNQNKKGMLTESRSDGVEIDVLNKNSVEMISSLLSTVTTVFRHLHSKGDEIINGGMRNNLKGNSGNSNIANKMAIKAAKEAVPPLLVAAALLENPIQDLRNAISHACDNDFTTKDIPCISEAKNGISVQAVKNSCLGSEQHNRSRAGSEVSWVDVTPSNIDYLEDNDGSAKDSTSSSSVGTSLPKTRPMEDRLNVLKSNQDALVHTAATLILNSMLVGGGEASTLIWRVVISTLSSCCPATNDIDTFKREDENSGDEPKLLETLHPETVDKVSHCVTTKALTTSEAIAPDDQCTPINHLAQSILCHLAAIVLTKIASKRKDPNLVVEQTNPWENVQLCSATARLCDLVEEKELLRIQSPRKGFQTRFSFEQVRLLCALLGVMASGRERTGWCQLVLPNPPNSQLNSENNPTEVNVHTSLHSELTPLRETPSLLDADIAGEDILTSVQSKAAKYIDEGLLAHNYEMYHQMTDFQFDDSFSSLPNKADQIVSSKGRYLHPHSLSSSKMLLPILQPSLRIILNCLGQLRSKAMIVTSHAVPTSQNAKDSIPHPSRKSLLSEIIQELRLTLTAAIVGLTFPNSRDACLNALSCLRKAVTRHQNSKDTDAVNMCCNLTVTIVEEMRVRYTSERKKREMAQVKAYEDNSHKSLHAKESNDVETISFSNLTPEKLRGPNDGKSVEETEAENSREVEILLLGNALTDRSNGTQNASVDITKGKGTEKNSHEDIESINESTSKHKVRGESDDFILFPHDHHGDHERIICDSGNTAMGWSNYRGFGSALEKWANSSPIDNTNTEFSSRKEPEIQHSLDAIFSVLAPYLDVWDDRQAQDAAESEFVELFDESASLGGAFRNDQGSMMLSDAVSGSETAADSMSSYIELASSENGRVIEIQNSHLPSMRYGRTAFAERQCWKFYFEVFDGQFSEGKIIFERCVGDGGRDYGGRLVTVPASPQFARSIPSQLDHSPISQPSNNDISDLEDESGVNKPQQGITVDMGEIKNLVELGSLTIVDITKKEAEGLDDDVDGSDNVLVSKPSSEGDNEIIEDSCDESVETMGGNFLSFPEKPDPDHEQHLKSEDEKESSGIDGGERYEENHSSSFPVSSQTAQNSEHSNPQHNFTVSSFSMPPESSSSILGHYYHGGYGGGISAGGGHGIVELYFDSCLHVKAEGIRKGTLLLTATYMIFEYDEVNGLLEGEVLALEETRKRFGEEYSPQSPGASDANFCSESYERSERQQKKVAALRPKSMRWNINELSHVYLRRYRLRDSALEMFFIPSGGSSTGGTGLSCALSSVFLDFGPGAVGNEQRDNAANAIMKRAPQQTVKQWPEKSGQFLQEQLRHLTIGWVKGRVSNFDYLLSLNCLAGRSFNDLCQYPVMPWVLSNYTSEEIPDLNDKSNFRDLSKPMGALNPDRLEEFIERFETFQDPTIPSFMYGSHYSTSAGVVLHFLVRLHPFSVLHRQLQGGHFDVADRLFSSIPRTWDMCTGSSAAEVKELTPEWYCNPTFLRNSNQFKLGTSQEGELMDDVILPPWANGSPEKFVEILRCALESDICTSMLPDWIDLIFGRKQQGPEAVKAHNVFFYLTYYGSVDVASIEDESLRTATELQIAHFGQCPMQLFWRPHVHKLSKSSPRRRLLFSEMLNLFDAGQIKGLQSLKIDTQKKNTEEEATNRADSNFQLPFQSAPISYWVHLFAPPPGPHAPLIAVRLAGSDRCLAVDAQGIFHSFRWAWKPELIPDADVNKDNDKEVIEDGNADDLFSDKGCFVAQRELSHFRSIPRLAYCPKTSSTRDWTDRNNFAVVAISKSLFASRSLLLVVSDGDGKGSLCMQMVDPAKGIVKGEVIVPFVHSAKITAIHMDPIGIAAGLGGVGGELGIVGSEDGTSSIWRFISSQYLPLRPRLRFGGHSGSKINAVALNSALNICATVSEKRCCLFALGNGAMINSFSPPSDCSNVLSHIQSSHTEGESSFAETNAVCISVNGFIVLVCRSTFSLKKNEAIRNVVTLELFSLEGVHIGRRVLESWRGVPHKLSATADGRAVMVCSGRGISIHKISATAPLEPVDEWQIAEDETFDNETLPSSFDVDFGPNLTRPVVAVTGCSEGALRLHALKGISEWSEENKKGSMTEAVGNVLSKPAQRFKSLVGTVKGTGSKFVGLGKEISREAISDVKEKGVGGFLGGMVSLVKKGSN